MYVVQRKSDKALLCKPLWIGDSVGWAKLLVHTGYELWKFQTRAGAERARKMHIGPAGTVKACNHL